ncbi:synaptobrevin protein [Diplodia corticola]|uniref:Synaptobrevin protein n=1 Tax=Diplodia corticola TaxID=236234 RepID=A0A1J9S0U8_9PEZI|nr:synaptobrevin protein [Diplodia corticola]OJD34207.1 synaptobrevin protein [Diplodia corticola]
MARTQSLPAHQPDPTQISLTRLLDRLQTALLSPDADPKLRTSSFERTKVGANLEYARSLLLRLEHDTAGVKIQSRKQAQQADLHAKRDLIRQLNQRLHDLNQLDDDAADDDISSSSYDDDDDEEDAPPPSYAPAHRNTAAGLNVEHNPGNQALQDAAENILRSRRPGQADPPSSRSKQDAAAATATGSSLFSGSKNAGADPTLQRSEKLMSHNRSEQETLTGSLLDMAQLLKQQTMQFGSSLEAEKDILDRAGKGLDTSAQGMEAAGQRMGTLRRMTEGKGWWARIRLYGIIGALWMACILIMFVMPKLRF